MALPGATQQLTEVAETDNVAFASFPKVVLEGVDGSQHVDPLSDIMTVPVLQHFFVAGQSVWWISIAGQKANT